MIKVSELMVYPIKSCRQKVVAERRVDAFGFAGDRRWMVVDSAGIFITQRRYPKLVLVDVEELASGITLSAEGMESLNVAIPDKQHASTLYVEVWGDACQVVSAGEEASDWFRRFLGIDCRLAWMPDACMRQVDTRYAAVGDRVSFSDGFPFLLISEASLFALNERMETTVPMKRFRPNIVISGCEPHEEDRWKIIRIGGMDFNVVKPCSRCVITTVDTQTGLKTGVPLRALADYRRFDNKILFGQNLVHHGRGVIAAGMDVDVIK